MKVSREQKKKKQRKGIWCNCIALSIGSGSFRIRYLINQWNFMCTFALQLCVCIYIWLHCGGDCEGDEWCEWEYTWPSCARQPYKKNYVGPHDEIRHKLLLMILHLTNCPPSYSTKSWKDLKKSHRWLIYQTAWR